MVNLVPSGSSCKLHNVMTVMKMSVTGVYAHAIYATVDNELFVCVSFTS